MPSPLTHQSSLGDCRTKNGHMVSVDDITGNKNKLLMFILLRGILRLLQRYIVTIINSLHAYFGMTQKYPFFKII